MSDIAVYGARIVLRDWREEDLASWKHWLSSGHRWQSLDAPYYPKPAPSDIARMLEEKRERIASGTWHSPRTELAVADAMTGRFIGMVSWAWESEATRWPSAGIVIFDEAWWGKGLGHEALGLWVDYVFAVLPDIVRLDLRTWSGNGGMMRLAEKLGFRLEACFRQARIVEGRYYDALGYGVLREEWKAHYPDGFAAGLVRHR